MKKFTLILILTAWFQLSNAQVTSPTFDPVWAAKFQNAINTALPGSGLHGVSVAITFPGMGTFIGVGGESAPGVPITPDMQFGIGDNTQLFTAVLALKLQELGILSLDDPLSKWLPSYANIDGNATIGQCLLYETGFFDYTNDIDPTMSDLVNETQQFYTQQQVLERVGAPHFKVGRQWSYSNTNYNLAALAMEAASRKTYIELLHQYIFDPLHLDSTFLAAYEAPNGNVAHGWYFNNDIGNTPLLSPNSMLWAAGGIYSTANEMAQWYDNLFAGKVINQSSLQQLRYFDKATWFSMGLRFLQPPGLPDDEVDGFIKTDRGEVPGYKISMGYDVKGRGTLCLLTNQGGDFGFGIFSVLIQLVTELYNDYPRRPDDAGLVKIVSPLSEKCDGSFTPEVLLQNFGSSTLQSVKINYQVDNGAIRCYKWTGNLVTDSTVNVKLPAVTAPRGSHSFKAFTSDPNGNAEGYNYNDAASSNFTINDGPFATSIDEGFEGAAFPAGWQNGNNTPYDWGQTSVGYFANGSNKGVAKNNWDEATGRSYDLELPYLNLSADKNPVLSFDYAYAFSPDCPSCIDELTVLVSKDCGKTYHPVLDKKGQELKTLNANTFHYPEPGDWGTRTVNLSAFKTNVFIKFRITNGNGNLIFLDNIKVSDVSALCQSPTDLDEVQITGSSVKLIWKFQETAKQFKIFYRAKNNSAWTHKTVMGNKQWTNISGLLPGTDYEWYITAVCKDGNSIASPKSYFTTEAAQATITSSLKMKENIPASALRFTVFPNPTTSSCIITFSLPKTEKVSVKIFDMNGRLMATIAETAFTAGEHQLKWNAVNVRTGVYVLRLQAGNYVETRKLVVAK